MDPLGLDPVGPVDSQGGPRVSPSNEEKFKYCITSSVYLQEGRTDSRPPLPEQQSTKSHSAPRLRDTVSVLFLAFLFHSPKN